MSEYFSKDRSLFERVVRAGWAPSVIYDIGAANGYWSDVVTSGFPSAEHHLFEPLASRDKYSKTLSHCLSANPKWKLHSIALGDRNGTVGMRVGEGDNIYGSTILDIGDTAGFESAIDVPQWRLDDFAQSNQLHDPDFVKIDAQASEHLIITGGRQTIAKASGLLVEIWLYRSYGPQTPLLGEIIDLVTPMGFVLFEFGGGEYRDTNGALASLDAVFTKPELAQALINTP